MLINCISGDHLSPNQSFGYWEDRQKDALSHHENTLSGTPFELLNLVLKKNKVYASYIFYFYFLLSSSEACLTFTSVNSLVLQVLGLMCDTWCKLTQVLLSPYLFAYVCFFHAELFPLHPTSHSSHLPTLKCMKVSVLMLVLDPDWFSAIPHRAWADRWYCITLCCHTVCRSCHLCIDLAL